MKCFIRLAAFLLICVAGETDCPGDISNGENALSFSVTRIAKGSTKRIRIAYADSELRDKEGGKLSEQDIANLLKTSGKDAVWIQIDFLLPNESTVEEIGRLMELFNRHHTKRVPVYVTFYIPKR
jgi:hypothetical protein